MTVTAAEDSVRFALNGEIDFYAVETLAGWLRDVETGHPRCVLVDLTNVAFIDSTGISVLLEACRRARAAGIDWRVFGATALPRKILQLTGVYEVLIGIPQPAP